MQRLFWIGSPFFSASLSACGWEVRTYNFEDIAVFSWQDVVRMAGWEPDVVVVADKSRPPFVLGMETFPCITVFYSVDSHIHSWHPLYAQGFDVCLVSLRDHMDFFGGKALPAERIWWSPPFARDEDAPVENGEQPWECLFVGTVDDARTPKRARFLAELSRHLPGLQVMRGNYRTLFGKGRVLLNHCEAGDLNFRVFEALGCGGCLVTPLVGHGLTELFVDGEHLVTYAPGDVRDAATKIRFLLGDPELTRYIGDTGRKLVDAGHRAQHRAQTFTDKMCDLWIQDAGALVQRRLAHAAALREKWLRMPYLLLAETMEIPLLRKAYLAAAGGGFGV
ncbi:MAG: glycosyltransferase [Desulfovibrionaceae bacterium]|nr:glycosyltransferase [Desulfovibrionaceae bacterium]